MDDLMTTLTELEAHLWAWARSVVGGSDRIGSAVEGEAVRSARSIYRAVMESWDNSRRLSWVLNEESLPLDEILQRQPPACPTSRSWDDVLATWAGRTELGRQSRERL